MMFNILLTADIHLRHDVPICRTDDFVQTQLKKLRMLSRVIKWHNVQLWLDAGDLFHKPKPPLHFVNAVMQNWPMVLDALVPEETPMTCFCTPGNHDMPDHNIERLNETALGILHEAGFVSVINNNSEPFYAIINNNKAKAVKVSGCAYGQEIPDMPKTEKERTILLYHGMVYENKKDVVPQNPGPTCSELLKRHKQFDLIVTGHNHRSFSLVQNGRAVINVGCLTRQAADYANHQPKVFIYDAITQNIIEEKITVAQTIDKKSVISDRHIREQDKIDDKLQAFLSGLSNAGDVSLSFQDNISSVCKEANASEKTMSYIRKAME